MKRRRTKRKGLGEFSTRQAEVHAADAKRYASRAEALAERGVCKVAVVQLVGAAVQTGKAIGEGSREPKRLLNDLHRAENVVKSNCTR